jgi:hypothetical protein
VEEVEARQKRMQMEGEEKEQKKIIGSIQKEWGQLEE